MEAEREQELASTATLAREDAAVLKAQVADEIPRAPWPRGISEAAGP